MWNVGKVLLAVVVGATIILLLDRIVLGPPDVAEPPDAEPPDIAAIPDPVAAGEPTPGGFRQLLARDRIEPIYTPVLVDAEEVDWDDGTQVLGIALDGEARAYPIRPLNRREIVNDRIADTPILASW